MHDHRRAWAIRGANFAAMFALLWFVNHYWFWPDKPLAPRVLLVLSGDEPHYMVMMHSLAFDGDLDVTDDYLAATRGGPQEGLSQRGTHMDHHTLWVDAEKGAYFRWWDLYDHTRTQACEGDKCTPFAQKAPPLPNPGMIERPLHPAGWPALLTAAVLPFRPTVDTLEPMAGLAIMTFVFITAIAAFFAALGFGFSDRWAFIAAWSLLAGSSVLVYSRSFFPEAGLTVMVALALWALRAERPVLSAIALTAAVVIKPNFGLVGAAFAIDLFLQQKYQPFIRFCATFAAGVLVFYLAFTKALLGVWLLPLPDGTFWPLTFAAMHHTLTSKMFGLLLFDPFVEVTVVLAAFAAWKHPEVRPALRQLLLPCAFWLVLNCGNKVDPGFCYGPRYWVPLLIFFVMAAWISARALGKPAIAVCAVVFAVSAGFAITDALSYDIWTWRHPPFLLRHLGIMTPS